VDRYLVYNAQCSTCSRLAESIRAAAHPKLVALSIYDSQAHSLLDQAYPNGWVQAPYLVFAHQGRVRAWTGVRAALGLGWLLGPQQAWRIWRLAWQSGVYVPLGMSATALLTTLRGHFTQLTQSGNAIRHTAVTNLSRRRFLKRGLALITAVRLARFHAPAPTYAAGESETATDTGYTTPVWVLSNPYPREFAAAQLMIQYDQYTVEGEYCGTSLIFS
jgi:predicted DCC family thiol-disulfide oxidoreductase YuxK